MQNLYSLTQKLLLILTLALFSTHLFAQDKITLTWQVDEGNTTKILICTAIGDFTVNWGDGIIETPPTYGGILSHTYTSTGEKEVIFTASNTDSKFTWLNCDFQKVSQLIFTDCSFLMMLFCNGNMITNLNLSGYENLLYLECENNLLTNLDLSGCVAITDISCNDNQITNLNVSGCDSVKWIHCQNNQITNLDVSEHDSLFSLNCINNKITHLNVSNCAALGQLICEENQITSLDLSGCLALETLHCGDNLLTGFDLSNFGIINYLSCSNNQIKLSELYATQLVINNSEGNHFGTQNLPNISANTNTELFEDQSVINGIYTEYSVNLNGSPAPQSNYTVKDGKLIFLKEGKYTVTMTNDAVLAHEYDPAQVVVPVEVTQVGVKENANLHIEVFPNPTRGELRVMISDYPISDIRLSDIEVFDIYGRKQKTESWMSEIGQSEIIINISDLSAGVYFVKINTDAGIVTKKVIKQ